MNLAFRNVNITKRNIKTKWQGFPGGTVVKNLPANAGDTVRALVWEDATCCGATKHMHHNY